MSDARPNLSPYNYCSLNPVMRVDPTGALDGENIDWIKDEKTGEYIWRDNVTSEETAPEGYTYVGADDTDILKDIGLPEELPSIKSYRKGLGIEGVDRIGGGIPVSSKAYAEGKIKISVAVGTKMSKVSKNNKEGKAFEGVTFTVNFNQTSAGTSSSTTLNYSGYFSVNYSGKDYSSYLEPLTGSYFYGTGTRPMQASVTIPAYIMSDSRSFSSAYISAGVTNPSLIINPRPIRMVWNLSNLKQINR